MANLIAETISIRETKDHSRDGTTVPSVALSIACNGVELNTQLPSLVVTDGNFREQLRWYLEDFAVHDPFQSTKAANVSLKLRAYTSALIDALQLEALVPYPERTANIIIRIHEAQEDSTIYRNTLWEALERVDSIEGLPVLSSLSIIRVVNQADQVQGTTDYQHERAAGIRRYNILALSARPRLAEDIHHRLITRPLLEISEQTRFASNVTVAFEIVRPATLEVLAERLSANKATDYNILHLDVHGSLDETGACLSFVKGTSDSLQEDLVPFENLLPHLKNSHLSLVVLNACESAVNGQIPNANIARRLAECGIPATVAMSFKVLDNAAAIFTQALYSNILYETHSIMNAVHAARRRLVVEPFRRTKFGTTVAVEDFIVPVLYQTYDYTETAAPEGTPRNAILNKTPPHTRLADATAFVGREDDILTLESHLLLHTPAFQLVGEPGVGKTALLESASAWWKATGLIDGLARVDMRKHVPWSRDSLNTEIANQLTGHALAGLGSQTNEGKLGKRAMVVLDGFATAGTIRKKTEQGEVKALIRQLLDSNFFVVVLSREYETWLRFLMNLSYQLPPLLEAEALMLGTHIVKKYGRPTESMDKRDLQALEHLIKLARGNPLALNLLLHDYCNQLSHPFLNTMEYHNYLLKGGRMEFDETWVRETRGGSAVLELRELFVLTESYTERRPLNSKFLLPFWDFLPVEDLTMYWLLTTWDWTPFESRRRPTRTSPDYSDLGILRALPDGRLKIVMDQYAGFRDTPEYTEVEPQVKEMLGGFVKSHYMEGNFPVEFKMANQTVQLEYYRLHALLPFVVRQFQNPELKHVTEACKRIVPIFYNYRMRSWPVWIHYKEAIWNVPKCILGQEFLNFLAAAYYTLELDPNIVNTSSLYWMFLVINKGALVDTSRNVLLSEFWRRTFTKVMLDKEVYQKIRQAGKHFELDRALRILGPLLRYKELTKLELLSPFPSLPLLLRQAVEFVTKRLPNVALELVAITSLSAMRNYQSNENPGSTAVYLSLMEKVYKERTVIPILDRNVKPMFDNVIQSIRFVEALGSAQRFAQAAALRNPVDQESSSSAEADVNSTSLKFFDLIKQFGLSRAGLGNSMSSSIEPLVIAQFASDEALNAGDTLRAKKILEEALLTEAANQNSAFNKARLYYCLSRVAEKEEDYTLALLHERRGWEVEVGAGMEKTAEQMRSFAKNIERLTMLSEKAGDGAIGFEDRA